jgi:hypothetical protein
MAGEFRERATVCGPVLPFACRPVGSGFAFSGLPPEPIWFPLVPFVMPERPSPIPMRLLRLVAVIAPAVSGALLPATSVSVRLNGIEDWLKQT